MVIAMAIKTVAMRSTTEWENAQTHIKYKWLVIRIGRFMLLYGTALVSAWIYIFSMNAENCFVQCRLAVFAVQSVVSHGRRSVDIELSVNIACENCHFRIARTDCMTIFCTPSHIRVYIYIQMNVSLIVDAFLSRRPGADTLMASKAVGGGVRHFFCCPNGSFWVE